MKLTAHYVSTNLKLKKTILNFCYFPQPQSGRIMANMISEFSLECGLENKVFTRVIDNASSNDNMMKIIIQSIIRSGHLHMCQIFHGRIR